MVSNGKSPAEGMIPAYTTTAVFVKDLYLHFGNKNKKFKAEMESASGEGYVSWGPISAGGHYESNNQTRSVQTHSDSQGIKIKGMQLIGFKCHTLGKSPNPKSEIKDWV